jgi:hypothetical protein
MLEDESCKGKIYVSVGLRVDVAFSDLAQSAGRLIGRLSLLEPPEARRSKPIISPLVLEIEAQENATSFFFSSRLFASTDVSFIITVCSSQDTDSEPGMGPARQTQDH